MNFKDLPAYARHTFSYDLKSAFFFGIFGGMLLPFISIIGRKIGATNFQIALLAATPYVANAFALLWTEDIFGKGRVWYVVWPSVLGRSLLFGMFFIKGPGYYTALIFLYMLVTAIPFPSYASIMKTNYPDAVRGRLMSFVRAVTAVLWMFSAFISGLILERDTYNYRYIFPFAALFGILAAFQFGAIKVRDEKKNRESIKGAIHIMTPLKNRPFQMYLLTYTLFESGLLIALPVIPLVLVDEAHITNFAAGVYGSVFSSMWLAGFFFWGRFLDKHSIRHALMGVFIAGSFIPLIYILSRNIYMLGVAQGISGFVAAAIELTGYVVVTRMSSSREVPRYMASNVAAGGLRGAVAPFVGTWLLSSNGAGAVFTVSLLFIVSAFLISEKLIKN